jgi:hypothetical protein
MIGRQVDTALPTIMFFHHQLGPRKHAAEVIRQSGFLKKYPGFQVGHCKEDIELLAASTTFPRQSSATNSCTSGTSEQSQHNDFFPPKDLEDNSFIDGTPVYFHPDQPSRFSGLTIYSQQKESGSIVVQSAHADVVFLAGKATLRSVSHIFAPRSEPVQDVSGGSDDEYEIFGASEDEEDLVEITSRGSLTPDTSSECAWSDDEDGDSQSTRSYPSEASYPPTPFNASIGTSSDASQQLDDVDRRLLQYSESVRPNQELSVRVTQPQMNPEDLVLLGYVSKHSISKDWALIDISNADVQHAISRQLENGEDKDEFKIGEPAKPNGQVEVLTKTPSGGLLSGILSDTPTYTCLPGSSKFQQVYRVQLDGIAIKGDCGSPVVDAVTCALYGYIVSGSESTGVVYVMAAHHAFEEMEQQTGNTLLTFTEIYRSVRARSQMAVSSIATMSRTTKTFLPLASSVPTSAEYLSARDKCQVVPRSHVNLGTKTTEDFKVWPEQLSISHTDMPKQFFGTKDRPTDGTSCSGVQSRCQTLSQLSGFLLMMSANLFLLFHPLGDPVGLAFSFLLTIWLARLCSTTKRLVATSKCKPQEQLIPPRSRRWWLPESWFGPIPRLFIAKRPCAQIDARTLQENREHFQLLHCYDYSLVLSQLHVSDVEDDDEDMLHAEAGRNKSGLRKSMRSPQASEHHFGLQDCLIWICILSVMVFTILSQTFRLATIGPRPGGTVRLALVDLPLSIFNVAISIPLLVSTWTCRKKRRCSSWFEWFTLFNTIAGALLIELADAGICSTWACRLLSPQQRSWITSNVSTYLKWLGTLALPAIIFVLAMPRPLTSNFIATAWVISFIEFLSRACWMITSVLLFGGSTSMRSRPCHQWLARPPVWVKLIRSFRSVILAMSTGNSHRRIRTFVVWLVLLVPSLLALLVTIGSPSLHLATWTVSSTIQTGIERIFPPSPSTLNSPTLYDEHSSGYGRHYPSRSYYRPEDLSLGARPFHQLTTQLPWYRADTDMESDTVEIPEMEDIWSFDHVTARDEFNWKLERLNLWEQWENKSLLKKPIEYQHWEATKFRFMGFDKKFRTLRRVSEPIAPTRAGVTMAKNTSTYGTFIKIDEYAGFGHWSPIDRYWVEQPLWGKPWKNTFLTAVAWPTWEVLGTSNACYLAVHKQCLTEDEVDAFFEYPSDDQDSWASNTSTEWPWQAQYLKDYRNLSQRSRLPYGCDFQYCGSFPKTRFGRRLFSPIPPDIPYYDNDFYYRPFSTPHSSTQAHAMYTHAAKRISSSLPPSSALATFPSLIFRYNTSSWPSSDHWPSCSTSASHYLSPYLVISLTVPPPHFLSPKLLIPLAGPQSIFVAVAFRPPCINTSVTLYEPFPTLLFSDASFPFFTPTSCLHWASIFDLKLFCTL